jgi:hypothetical protein
VPYRTTFSSETNEMRTTTTVLLIALAAATARADFATADFEDRYPGPDTVANDFRASGDAFTSGGFTFSNHYVPPSPPFADFYSGFGVSSRIDNVPPNDPFGSADFGHSAGAYSPEPMGAAGTGSGGSATYSVVFNYFVGDAVVDLPAGFAPASIDVANTTYAASPILFGDAFSRPFRSGDFFRLDIIGFDAPGARGAEVGTVSFYLADFRGGLSAVVDHFTTVDLSSLAGARSLGFLLDTNVTNTFGPSIPFTFAADDLVGVRAVPEPSGLLLCAIGALALVTRAAYAVPRRCVGDPCRPCD